MRAGAGSARDSLSILDQLLAGADEAGITYARAVSLLGYTDGDLLDEIVAAFARRDGAEVFQAVNRVIEGGHDPRRFAMDLLERFRDLVVLANVPEAAANGLLDRPADELERLIGQAASMGPAELTRAAEVFNAGLTEMRGAASPRLLLELMCARILLPAAAQGEVALLARLERLERGGVAQAGGAPLQAAAPPVPSAMSPGPPAAGTVIAADEPSRARPSSPAGQAAPDQDQPGRSRPAQSGAPQTPAARTPADDWPVASRPGGSPQSPARRQEEPPGAPPGQVSAPGGPFHQAWPQVLEVLKQRSPAVWANVNTNSQLVGVEGNIVTLGFSQVGAMRNFVNGAKDSVVATAITAVLGGTWRVEAVVASSGGAPAAQAVRQAPAAPRPARSEGPPVEGAQPTARKGPDAAQGAQAPARSQATAQAAQAVQSSQTAPSPSSSDEPWPDAPPPDDEGHPPGPGGATGDAPAARSGIAAARSAAKAAAQAGPRQAGSAGWPDAVPRRSGPPAAEAEVDPYNDEDAGADSMSGMALVQRELGGQIIGEIDHT